MSRLAFQIPKYGHYRASGQAVVSLNGHDVYLGPYRSAASKAEYRRLIVKWKATVRQPPPALTNPAELIVTELVDRYGQRRLPGRDSPPGHWN